MGMKHIKRLGRRVTGQKILVPSSDPNYEFEEVRTCYDNPRFLPKYDRNEDDEDLSDCDYPQPNKRGYEQFRCDMANYARWQAEEQEY